MATLTHQINSSVRSSGLQVPARAKAAKPHLAATQRVLLYASIILLAGGGLAAIIVLKTAIYFFRYHLGAG